MINGCKAKNQICEMSEFENSIKIFVADWSKLLITNVMMNSGLTSSQIQSQMPSFLNSPKAKNANLPLEEALELFKTYDKERAKIEIEAIQSIIFQCYQNQIFPRVFINMIVTTHAIFSIFEIDDPNEKKPKALHTDAIVAQENLTDLEIFECSVFIFLSKFFLMAIKSNQVNFDQIEENVISSVFKFMNHNEPNTVRRSAGEILAAMSANLRLCQIICDVFWKQFGTCKREIDYRNFATWVDGIVNISFSFHPPELGDLSLQFLRTFINMSKKIDRGVLRMKFLDALIAIIQKLMGDSKNHVRDDFKALIIEIWGVVMKWSTKGKHTVFCYSFLCKLISFCPFLIEEYSYNFAISLTKLIKKAEKDILELLPLFFESIPKEIAESSIRDLFNEVFLPNILGTNEKRRAFRFEFQDESIIIEFFRAVGDRSPNVLLDFASSVMAVEKPADDHKYVRLIILKALSNMNTFKTFSTPIHTMSEYMIPILQENGPEVPYILNLFPMILEKDPEAIKEFLRICSTKIQLEEAQNAIARFIAFLVTPAQYLNLAISYLDANINNTKLLMEFGDSLIQALLPYKTPNTRIIQTNSPEAESWINFRIKFDGTLLKHVINGNQDAIDCVIKFAHEVIHKLDKEAINDDNIITLSQVVLHHDNSIEFSKEGIKIVQGSQKYTNRLFDQKISHQLPDEGGPKCLEFKLALATQTNDYSRAYITSVMKLVADDMSYAIAFSALPYQQWLFVISGKSLLQTSIHWESFINVLYRISTQPIFPQKLQEDINLVKALTPILHKWAKKKKNNSILDERAFYFLNSYSLGGSRALNTLHEGHLDSFIGYLLKKSQGASETTIVAILDCLKTLLSKSTLERTDSFLSFSKWLNDLSTENKFSNLIQSRIISLLTSTVIRDPKMLREVFRASLSRENSSNYVVAIGNVLLNPRFDELYNCGRSIILASIIAHIDNPDEISRQATFKIIFLCGRKNFFKGDIHETEIVVSSLESYGYVHQAKHFIEYMCNNASDVDLKGCIMLIAEDFAFFEDSQERVIPNVAPLVRRMAHDSGTLTQLLNMTTRVRQDSTSIATAMKKLWYDYFEISNEYFLARQVFQYATIFSPKSPEVSASAHVLASVFTIKPKEVAGVLIPVLSKFDRRCPKDLEEFKKYAEKDDVDFAVTTKEIVAACALSDILFQLESIDLFKELILPYLAPLVFFAVIEYHAENMEVPGFHPLLDAIIDACLLRLVAPKENFTANLEKLQQANLIKRAASLLPQNSVILEQNVKQVLCYDHAAVTTICQLMKQVDEHFICKYFEIVFANAVRASKNERSMEPMVMLMAFSDELTTRTVYLLNIFILECLGSHRDELLDPIIDVLHDRLLSDDLDLESFKDEVPPTLCSLITIISTDTVRGLPMVAMKLITDLVEKSISRNVVDIIADRMKKFIDSINGDEFVASIFVPHVQESPSFAEDVVVAASKALICLSYLLGEKSYCGLFGKLIENTRMFLDKYADEKEEENDENTAEKFICDLVNDVPDMIGNIIDFCLALLTTFSCNDLYIDTLAFDYLASALKNGKLELSESRVQDISLLAFMLPMNGDAKLIPAASNAMFNLISLYPDNHIYIDILDFDPKFTVVTRKPINGWKRVDTRVIDREKLPVVEFMNVEAVQDIVDILSTALASAQLKELSEDDLKTWEPDFNKVDKEVNSHSSDLKSGEGPMEETFYSRSFSEVSSSNIFNKMRQEMYETAEDITFNQPPPPPKDLSEEDDFNSLKVDGHNFIFDAPPPYSGNIYESLSKDSELSSSSFDSLKIYNIFPPSEMTGNPLNTQPVVHAQPMPNNESNIATTLPYQNPPLSTGVTFQQDSSVSTTERMEQVNQQLYMTPPMQPTIAAEEEQQSIVAQPNPPQYISSQPEETPQDDESSSDLVLSSDSSDEIFT